MSYRKTVPLYLKDPNGCNAGYLLNLSVGLRHFNNFRNDVLPFCYRPSRG